VIVDVDLDVIVDVLDGDGDGDVAVGARRRLDVDPAAWLTKAERSQLTPHAHARRHRSAGQRFRTHGRASTSRRLRAFTATSPPPSHVNDHVNDNVERTGGTLRIVR